MTPYIIAIATLLLFLIALKIYQTYKNSRINIDSNEFRDLVLFKISYADVCRDLSYEEIYTKNDTIRATVQKKIKSQMALYQCDDGDWAIFLETLTDKNLTHNNTMARRNISVAAGIYRDMFQNNFGHQYHEEFGISVPQFFQMKKAAAGDFVGVYVLYNKSKNMYYVGQATRLLFRVNQHFTGHGNGDVYADFKYHDEFIIKIIKLVDSGYEDLDKLEKDMIQKYHAFIDGYNKTAGNG